MRMREVSTDDKTGSINIDVSNFDKPVLIMVSEGKVKQTELPDFGETKIITHHGQVKRVKFEEGEEF